MAEHSRARALGSRWLGAGLATVLAVVTLALGLTGRLTLYVAPESVWFVCAGAVVVLIGAVWSCTLPLGAESDHDHGHDHDQNDVDAAPHRTLHQTVGTTATVVGGLLASAVVVGALVLPAASLSAELAVSRADTAAPLFAGADEVQLGVVDTSTFQLGDWASAFATATRPESYDGAEVKLTGFATPGDDGMLDLTRMVITHCVIDAQPASVPLSADAAEFDTGQWLEVTGTVHAGEDGTLSVAPSEIVRIDEPREPYEF